MNYMNWLPNDLVNAKGASVSLWVSGCCHRCAGCFNSEAWSYDAGRPFTWDTINSILDAMKPDFIENLVILGGEPLDPKNVTEVCRLVKLVKDQYPNKKIWIYTGFTIGQLYDSNDQHVYDILKLIDVLVDGKFFEDLKDPSLKYRGSSNQRVIDMKKTLETHERRVVWYPTGDEPQQALPETGFKKLVSKVKDIFRR